MIVSKKQAKRLKMKDTIDLKEIYCREYLQSKKGKTLLFIENNMKKIAIILSMAGLFLFFGMLYPAEAKNNSEQSSMTIRDKIRAERLEICQEAYKKSWINERFIYEQLPVVRCATYMWLIYAYESGFGTSRMCLEDKNCHWMKWNWVDHKAWFIKFDTFREGREWFADRYFKFHYKKKINEMVNSWSMTDRATYKAFMWDRYSEMYGELEYYYLSWKIIDL